MYELNVEGMSCNHCVSMVTKSVLGVDGAAKVKVDLAGQKVHVESSADIDVIKSAVIEAGYPVTGASVA
ncbi:MAG TPA: cation transporter [Noviherbaspirillum sp.]|uniref:heavy-metal-associated domain-containing protein n=1 Tax=Noviherbaspirillum sp. TaxID=1926288 RepID=UPI002DDD49B4|nr:cation transporter [Noviherbaspirillum sp.]HEV2610677.1 cation transporter [Noviherbaspirillum sp.]